MSELRITKPAVRLLRSMIVSCGNINCFEAMKVLDSVEGTIDYDAIAKIPSYSYRLKAFERLEKYAQINNLKLIDLFDVAMYFGGDYHISLFEEFAAHAVLARYLGEVGDDFGLISHVLLPLTKSSSLRGTKQSSFFYRNHEYEFEIKGAFHINPKSEGIPCFHLGLIVNVPLTDAEIDQILDVQYKNEVFREHLSALPEVIEIPKEYYQALNCIATKA